MIRHTILPIKIIWYSAKMNRDIYTTHTQKVEKRRNLFADTHKGPSGTMRLLWRPGRCRRLFETQYRTDKHIIWDKLYGADIACYIVFGLLDLRRTDFHPWAWMKMIDTKRRPLCSFPVGLFCANWEKGELEGRQGVNWSDWHCLQQLIRSLVRL